MSRPKLLPLLAAAVAVLALLAFAAPLSSTAPASSLDLFEAAPGITFESVNFTSHAVASGLITLFGTLVLPDSSAFSPPYRGAVLLTGSGPNDRWESDGDAKPFYDIATQLATIGIASLAFDKRSCTAAVHELCKNVLCSDSAKPAANGCVSFLQLRVDDFLSDGSAALDYLLTRTDVVQSERLIVIGHSQGVTTGFALAAQYADEGVVDAAVLLMGAGRSIDQVLALQAEAQAPLAKEALQYWLAQPSSPERDANVAFLNATLQAFDCTSSFASPQFSLLSGQIDPLASPPSLLCPSGVVVNQSASFCPAACGTGICAVGMNSEACLEECSAGLRNGACQLSRFWGSWFNLSLPTAMDAALTTLATRNVSLSILNSPSDLLVPPVSYLPLHMSAQTAYETPASNCLNVTQLANLTHLMTDEGTGSSNVSASVLNWLTEQLAQTSLRDVTLA